MVIKILLAHQNRQSNGNLGRQAALILLGFSKVFSASEMLRFDCEALPPMPVRYRPRDRGWHDHRCQADCSVSTGQRRPISPTRPLRKEIRKIPPRPLSKRMIEAIRHALESAGVEFVGENGGGPGGAQPSLKRVQEFTVGFWHHLQGRSRPRPSRSAGISRDRLLRAPSRATTLNSLKTHLRTMPKRVIARNTVGNGDGDPLH